MIIGLIGSLAMNMRIGEEIREPRDLDIVGSYDDIQEFITRLKAQGAKILAQYPISSGKKLYIRTDTLIIEAEIAWPDSSAEALLTLIEEDTRPPPPRLATRSTYEGIPVLIPSLHLLYMLKMSHRYLKNSPHFLKTMHDIRRMRACGAKLRPEHQAFYEQRMKDTYTYSHPKLNVDKTAFFTDDVPYVYDHDSIHMAVKHLEKPAYTYFKPDDSEVAVSREMFEKLERHVKMYSVLEEVYVLALERSQIPFPATDKRKSFDMAHMKVCTSITSGWWREFAWEYYHVVQSMYDEEYVARFHEAVAAGKVKLYKEEK